TMAEPITLAPPNKKCRRSMVLPSSSPIRSRRPAGSWCLPPTRWWGVSLRRSGSGHGLGAGEVLDVLGQTCPLVLREQRLEGGHGRPGTPLTNDVRQVPITLSRHPLRVAEVPGLGIESSRSRAAAVAVDPVA